MIRPTIAPPPSAPAIISVLFLLTLVLLGGCAGRTGNIHDETFEVARSVEDRPIHARVLGDGPLTVLVKATIHGDEPVGTPMVERLADELLDRPELLAMRTVVLMPNVNPDGMANDTRQNVRGVDLNRDFPAPNYRGRHDGDDDGPLSEPESRAVHELMLQYQPRRIVSIHQPLACIDWDGPLSAERLAHELAAMCDLPVRKLGSRHGSLGAYAGETLGMEVITLEFRPDDHKRPEEEMWEQYGPMLMHAVLFTGADEPVDEDGETAGDETQADAPANE